MKKVAILNYMKFNYDGKLDFSALRSIAQISEYEFTPIEDIAKRAQGQDIIITKELPVSAEVVAALPGTVKLICEAGTGYNNIDIKAARERGITVCNVPGYSTYSVAQLAIALMLNLSSSIQKQISMLRQGNYENFTKFLQVPHHDVEGKILGVIGAGAIGRQVIKVALALGMKVLYYDVQTYNLGEGVRFADLEELLKESDFISIHSPLTDKTKHLIDMNKLKMMKKSAFIINTSRGAIIKESDLIIALKEGLIAGAALDVQEIEPPAVDNPLFSMENVIMTPHIGWQTVEARQRLVEKMTENIKSFLEGRPINVVN